MLLTKTTHPRQNRNNSVTLQRRRFSSIKKYILERVGGIDRSALLSGDSGLGLRSTATGSRSRPVRFRGTQQLAASVARLVFKKEMERVGGIEPPTKPWEGLVLPLNHTRQRFAVYGLLAVLASLWLPFVPLAGAQDIAPQTIHVDESTSASGWRLRLTTGADLAFFPGVVPTGADVSWSVSTDATPTLPANMVQSGLLYRATISNAAALNATDKSRLAVALPDSTTLWSKSIWLYDVTAKTWIKLPSGHAAKVNAWQAGYATMDAYLTVLEDRTTEIGIASWYCRKSCLKRYPTLHGTSNEFPVGTKVKVTNLENGKNVTVKIVSKWGQPAGRVIDLSGAAYDVLKAKNKGLTKVSVTSNLATPTVTTPTLTAETYPKLTPKSATGTLPPKISASSYSVIDAATGTVLAEKNSDVQKPIASLTKLMTAMVWLDTNPDLKKVMTYSKSDVTAYAYLRVKVSETLTTKDLFYSMVVGSANNAATALARSTGMTTTEFVAAMNAKAKSWGLTETTFVDVHGLDPKNVSSTSDIAIIASHAFHDYPLLKKASLTTVYNFRTVNTKIAHSIATTDKLLLSPGKLTITGNKTGYLDEAKYTYALRVANKQGAQIIVVVFGEPTSALRFSDAAKLASWSLTAFSWK